MGEEGPHLPEWVIILSGYSSVISTLIIFVCIFLHLINYRKPFEQRLMIRIQMIVPLFAVSCFSMLLDQKSYVNRYLLEPTREVYEAFVIYTFFSLLTDMLGGERNIIITTSGREPVSHPGILRYILPDLDISDPHTFLGIKRGILQYVWLKPFICFGTILADVLGLYDSNKMGASSIYLWLTIIYNFSVTMSLYCLAIFWKILWNDLKPFKPVSKFLCVKLIIFASYWQGILLAILNALGVLPGSAVKQEPNVNIGISIQNALLCFELIGFAVGHWHAFSYRPFTISNIPYSRFKTYYAIKDVLGIRDLVYDFRVTYNGDYYKNYKKFDSVEAMITHPDSKGRMSRIKQGLRYHSDGKQKHWLPNQTSGASNASITSTSELNAVNSQSLTTQPTTEYAKSINSNGTSTRGLFSSSPKYIASFPESPVPSIDIDNEEACPSITDILNTDTINYDKEMLDEDEKYYKKACSVINNYNLDQVEVKRLVNYPVVDDIVDGHQYKVRLRERQRSINEPVLRNSDTTRHYGSIV
ncbi:uncharacterized protein PRCAT00004796001 [Priceomyces carsonii]|uniref:uncharacterized protein n=1 Tax=Priceomyces carsonii TaxID=28549 RepID=UPI002EDA501E|nr:unnamed protein product [Priceomyces carsonii]